jgi:Leucine-rich repeat (LRR) protein
MGFWWLCGLTGLWAQSTVPEACCPDSVLRWPRQQLTGLPPVAWSAVKGLPLVEIDLTGNRLTTVPPDIGRIQTLRRLILSGNPIVRLPDSLVYCHQLEEITLDVEAYHHTDSLLALLDRLPRLRYLTLTYWPHTQLNLPARLATRLERLTLTHGRLTRVPPALAQALSLQELNLAHQQLPDLAHTVLHLLPQLRVLNLSGNPLTVFPTKLPPTLTHLYLANTQLTEVSGKLPSLPSLRVLSLERNRLKTLRLPEGSLPELRILILAGNQLKASPSGLEGCSRLTELDLSDNRLDDLPTVLASLPLVRLNLARNRLTHLPRVNGWAELLELDLSRNRWVRWEKAVARMPNLQILHMADARLTHIRPVLRQALSLRVLNLTNNRLEELPRCILALRQLETLVLRRTRLEEVPTRLGDLNNLRFLDLAQNKLTTLPTGLARLQHLETLDVTRNRLRTLAWLCQHWPALQALYCGGNPLDEPLNALVGLTELTTLVLPANTDPVHLEGLRKLRPDLQFQLNDAILY